MILKIRSQPIHKYQHTILLLSQFIELFNGLDKLYVIEIDGKKAEVKITDYKSVKFTEIELLGFDFRATMGIESVQKLKNMLLVKYNTEINKDTVIVIMQYLIIEIE